MFKTDLEAVMAVANAKNKKVWITETGWPHRKFLLLLCISSYSEIKIADFC